MKFYKFILLCLFSVAINSCSKHHYEVPPDLGYDYYPGKKGNYIVYDVDSISYTKLPAIDTFTYKFQIKEKIDTIFTDNQNRPTLKIIRYKKIYSATIPYSQMTWTLQNVWAANITKTTAEVVEENIRLTKLIFPARLNATWNGNAQNTLGEWDYKYTVYDSPATIGGISFGKTLKVTQKYFPSAISYQNYYEQYAKGVGMIYRIIEDYDYQDGFGNANPGHIYSGIYYRMTINSYGTE
jgi:hypothetical protein